MVFPGLSFRSFPSSGTGSSGIRRSHQQELSGGLVRAVEGDLDVVHSWVVLTSGVLGERNGLADLL